MGRDAKAYRGRVERRDAGRWLKADNRLFVGGRDRTGAIDGLARQVDAVARVVADPGVPIRPALCFVGAEWGWFTQPFELRGVLVTWPRRLARSVDEPGPLDPDAVRTLATHLGRDLPPK